MRAGDRLSPLALAHNPNADGFLETRLISGKLPP